MESFAKAQPTAGCSGESQSSCGVPSRSVNSVPYTSNAQPVTSLFDEMSWLVCHSLRVTDLSEALNTD